MPRPNKARSLQSEDNVARRVVQERSRLGWSYEGLADRMTEVGCPIQPSAIYKIEKQGRRITVDELVAFGLVFKLDVPELLDDPDLVADSAVRDLLEAWRKASADHNAALSAMIDHVKQFPDAEPLIERHMTPADRQKIIDLAMVGIDKLRRRPGSGQPFDWDKARAASEAAKRDEVKARRPRSRRG